MWDCLKTAGWRWFASWLSRRRLVTSAGVSYLRAHDEHRDYALTLGGQYYFEEPWILMPVLYVFAGLSLEILLAVAFYGWAMSLSRKAGHP
jgi:hypothetical protein